MIINKHNLLDINESDIRNETVEIPNNVWYIDRAFSYKENIKKIIIPQNVRRIKKFGFIWCKNLEKVEFRNNDCKLDSSVFSNCKNLIEVV